MIRDRVLAIQFALLLVAIPLVHGVLANGYTVQHEEQDSYYDQESHPRHSVSDENNIEDDHKPGGYSYQYQVHSPRTGDYKTQHEERIGDVVRGSYSLIDPDGMRRIVEYTADPVHGFKAVVKREPTDMHLQHQPEPQPEPQPQPQPQPQQHYRHLSPQLIQPKPITKPPLVPRPTPPTKPSYPMRIKYPVNLFDTTHQPIPVYYETTSIPAHKVRNTPHKYSFFRFHGWPFVY